MRTLASILRTTFRPLAVALLASAALVPAQGHGSGPNLPPGCEALRPPAGNRVSFHVYALGVQIYQWDQTTSTWVFQEPLALMYADSRGFLPVGVHYVGPTWTSFGGSQVVGRVSANCAVDPTAIPWLLLTSVSTAGYGPFTGTTFIQRVNTVAGRAPTRPGTGNERVYVPYTAEYYFYRAQ